MVQYKNANFAELDIDEALRLKPDLILVDELAHTNATGCRNVKRYQDVLELLEAGHQCLYNSKCPARRKSQ